MEPADRAAIVAEMLAAARLPDTEVEQRVRDATRSDYWLGLCPDCAVEATPSPRTSADRAPSDDELTRCVEAFRTDGSFTTGDGLPADVVARMRGSVERIKDAGWPPVFAFVYDEFWLPFRTRTLEALLRRLLGPGYRQNSVFWTYYIAPRDGASGWKPHADDNGAHRLTIWIPLTDATVDNGCIYVIPRRDVPASLPPAFRQWTTVDRAQLEQLLQGARALPARAGSVLGWSHDVVHWGSIVKGATTPRISIAVEFVAATEQPTHWEQPILSLQRTPSLAERLYAIGKCLKQYQTFEPLMGRYATLAERLMKEAGSRP